MLSSGTPRYSVRPVSRGGGRTGRCKSTDSIWILCQTADASVSRNRLDVDDAEPSPSTGSAPSGSKLHQIERYLNPYSRAGVHVVQRYHCSRELPDLAFDSLTDRPHGTLSWVVKHTVIIIVVGRPPMSQMARVWIREQGLTIPVTEDLPEAFANGYRFAQIMHRLGGISDDTFSRLACTRIALLVVRRSPRCEPLRFRDKSTPAAILSNFSLLVSWLCRAFHLQVSQRTVNDIIAKRPNAAVRLLKRIRKASHASHSQVLDCGRALLVFVLIAEQVPRTSSSTTDSAGDDEADARERLLVTATLDKGVPVTDNVLLMRRFYEAQLVHRRPAPVHVPWGLTGFVQAQERAFDRDQDEQLRRKRDAFLERYRAEQEHMHQRKVDRQTGAIASSQQAKVNRDRIFANERREVTIRRRAQSQPARRRLTALAPAGIGAIRSWQTRSSSSSASQSGGTRHARWPRRVRQHPAVEVQRDGSPRRRRRRARTECGTRARAGGRRHRPRIHRASRRQAPRSAGDGQ